MSYLFTGINQHPLQVGSDLASYKSAPRAGTRPGWANQNHWAGLSQNYWARPGSMYCNDFLLGVEVGGMEGRCHRVIMYFIETKATSCLPYFGHLPLNTYLSVVCIAAVATVLGSIKNINFYSFVSSKNV